MTKRKKTDMKKNFTVVIYRTALKNLQKGRKAPKHHRYGKGI